MTDRTCVKCGHEFRDPSKLRRHMANKRSCAPIIEPTATTEVENCCKYCGRAFASKTSMYRHIRQNCKIANSEEGMEKLFEHTLQQQNRELKAEVAEVKVHMGRLAELLEKQLALSTASPRAMEIDIRGNAQINNGPVTNNTAVSTNTSVTNVQINIRPEVPWDGERRINVNVAQIAAAFAENARLKEYSLLEEHQLTDPEIAPPYVTELLMDLTKRAHADPMARNVYLNPKRANQALVHLANGKWEVMLLQEATRLIFDGVAKAMVRVTMSNEERRQLPLEAQNALAMAGLLYDDEPDEYAKKAKAPMAAHLANTAPQLCQ